MINATAFFTTILMCYLFYGFYISTYTMEIAPEPSTFQSDHEIFDYRGVTHSHSNLSEGIGPPEELIQSAQNADLDFLFLTDSNTFKHAINLEGYHDDLLVFTFAEHDYLDSRFLYISENRNRPMNSLGEVQVGFADILSNRTSESMDDFVILTHPLLNRFKWDRPYPPGLTSIEVFNLKSIWNKTWSESALYGMWSILVYPFNPTLALIRLFSTPNRELELWDGLSKQRPTMGYFGQDATARALPFKGVPIRFPSYENLFRIGSNHVLLHAELTGNSQSDRTKVLSALKRGQFYMSFDILGNPKGFICRLISPEKKFLPGARVPLHNDYLIETKIPEHVRGNFEVHILHDGQIIHKTKNHSSRIAISEPGAYRIEVWVRAPFPFPDTGKEMIWIATNPFFISAESE